MDEIDLREYERIWELLSVLEVKNIIRGRYTSLTDINHFYLTRAIKNRLLWLK